METSSVARRKERIPHPRSNIHLQNNKAAAISFFLFIVFRTLYGITALMEVIQYVTLFDEYRDKENEEDVASTEAGGGDVTGQLTRQQLSQGLIWRA